MYFRAAPRFALQLPFLSPTPRQPEPAEHETPRRSTLAEQRRAHCHEPPQPQQHPDDAHARASEDTCNPRVPAADSTMVPHFLVKFDYRNLIR